MILEKLNKKNNYFFLCENYLIIENVLGVIYVFIFLIKKYYMKRNKLFFKKKLKFF